MRTPLNSVLLGLDALRNEIFIVQESNKEIMLEMLNVVRESCLLTGDILNELTFDIYDTRNLKLEKVPIALLDFMNSTLEPFYHQVF